MVSQGSPLEGQNSPLGVEGALEAILAADVPEVSAVRRSRHERVRICAKSGQVPTDIFEHATPVELATPDKKHRGVITRTVCGECLFISLVMFRNVSDWLVPTEQCRQPLQ